MSKQLSQYDDGLGSRGGSHKMCLGPLTVNIDSYQTHPSEKWPDKVQMDPFPGSGGPDPAIFNVAQLLEALPVQAQDMAEAT